MINLARSDLVPKQLAKYLGMSIDSAEARIRPIDSRIDKFREVSAQFLAVPEPPARLWQIVLSPMASLERLVPFGRIRMRSLQFRLREFWSPESDLPTQPVPLDPAVVEDLTWWRDAGNLRRGVPMSSPPPEMLLCTDASKVGWGAHLLDLFVSGVWTEDERHLHINVLEMRAVLLALQSFQGQLWGHHVGLMSDNSTVVA